MKKVATGVLVALIALAVAPWLIWWTSLPDPMASHWSGGSARPDDHMPRAVLFLLLAGLTTGFVISALTALHGSRASRGASAAPAVGFAAGVLAMISFSAVYVQRGSSSWEEGRWPLGWLAAAIGAGVAVATVAAVALPVAQAEERRRPSVRIGRSEALAWSGHARAPWMLVVAATLMAFGAVMIAAVSVFGGVVTILAGLMLVWFSATHVVVGRSGVRVRGALAWPSFSIPLGRIESAESTLVEPMQWGGWGYRGSMRFGKAAGFIVRRGEGLKLNMRKKKPGVKVTFTVTVDDSDAAAAVVNGLINSSARSR